MKKYSNGTIFCDIDGTLVYLCSIQNWNPFLYAFEAAEIFPSVSTAVASISGGAYSWSSGGHTSETTTPDKILLEEKKETTLIYPLKDAIRKLKEWHISGYRIILTTSRPEPLRMVTEKMLAQFNMLYDQLIMGLPCGPRILINDINPDSPSDMSAISFCIERNKGLGDIDLP